MGASTTMSGTFDPAAMDAKLDRILGQLTTMNNRLDSHDARLARVETGKQKKIQDKSNIQIHTTPWMIECPIMGWFSSIS